MREYTVSAPTGRSAVHQRKGQDGLHPAGPGRPDEGRPPGLAVRGTRRAPAGPRWRPERARTAGVLLVIQLEHHLIAGRHRRPGGRAVGRVMLTPSAPTTTACATVTTNRERASSTGRVTTMEGPAARERAVDPRRLLAASGTAVSAVIVETRWVSSEGKRSTTPRRASGVAAGVVTPAPAMSVTGST